MLAVFVEGYPVVESRIEFLHAPYDTVAVSEVDECDHGESSGMACLWRR